MRSVSESPVFRIQTVSELTGVNPVTLRAWERRYGVPRPSRTSGAYRLYSDSDVEQVRRMCELCDSGVSASEAAKTVRQALEQNPPMSSVSADVADGVTLALIDAISHMDSVELERQMSRALTLGSASEVFERAIAPVMRRVGELWERGELSIAHEHVAVEFFFAQLGQLLRLVQPHASAPLALLGCFPDELHGLPLYGVAFQLAESGYRTQMLGQRTPPVALAEAVKSMKPELVALSVTIPATGAATRETIQGYALACAKTPWLVGGAGIASVAELVQSEGGIAVPREPNALRHLLQTTVSAHGCRQRGRKR